MRLGATLVIISGATNTIHARLSAFVPISFIIAWCTVDAKNAKATCANDMCVCVCDFPTRSFLGQSSNYFIHVCKDWISVKRKSIIPPEIIAARSHGCRSGDIQVTWQLLVQFCADFISVQAHWHRRCDRVRMWQTNLCHDNVFFIEREKGLTC